MGISILVHGGHGSGKSTFAGTAPGPRLHLDAEGGADWLPGKKIVWSDLSKLPEGIDDDTTVIVNVATADLLTKAFQWLQVGKHPFRSVTLDSLTEMQQRVIDSIAGTNQMQLQDWGSLKRVIEKLIRDIKDLKVHPTNPLDAVVFICASQHKENEPWAPALQGSVATSVPFYVDVVGCAALVVNEETGHYEQRMQILPTAHVVAKDRTRILSDTFGPVLVNPNIAELLKVTQQQQDPIAKTA